MNILNILSVDDNACLQPLCQFVCDVANLRYCSNLKITVAFILIYWLSLPVQFIAHLILDFNIQIQNTKDKYKAGQSPPLTCHLPWRGSDCCLPSSEFPSPGLARPTRGGCAGCERSLTRSTSRRNCKTQISKTQTGPSEMQGDFFNLFPPNLWKT